MAERVACFLCDKTFGGADAIEKLERHEARLHPPSPPPPSNDFEQRMNDENAHTRGVSSSLREDLETLGVTMRRVETLAKELGHRDLADWAQDNAEASERWARGF